MLNDNGSYFHPEYRKIPPNAPDYNVYQKCLTRSDAPYRFISYTRSKLQSFMTILFCFLFVSSSTTKPFDQFSFPVVENFASNWHLLLLSMIHCTIHDIVRKCFMPQTNYVCRNMGFCFAKLMLFDTLIYDAFKIHRVFTQPKRNLIYSRCFWALQTVRKQHISLRIAF